MSRSVKTRFAPSPTGYLHVGGARTALFSWLYARHCGGTFLLRIEDTDRDRHVEGAAGKIVEDLRWLGLDWDEGYAVGGPHGPYVQSERLEVYRRHVGSLLEEGKAYYAFESAQELDALRRQAEARKQTFRYTRPAELRTDAAAADAARSAGAPVTVRFAVPGHDVTVHDEVFGDVTVGGAEQEDFVILKDDGYPTYHLANVVDDGRMGITHVLRGQEFLGQTWRQSLLREAMGFPEPVYAHLPLILDMEGRKLSKRDGAVEVHGFRAEGYLPEAMLNFIALLGWSAGGDREVFTRQELVEAFSLDRLSKANAKFDRAKLLAFNTDTAARLGVERLAAGLADYLSFHATPIPADDPALLTDLVNACGGMRTFADVVHKTAILFAGDAEVVYDPSAVEKVLAKGGGAGFAVLAELRGVLSNAAWTAEGLRGAIDGYCQAKGLSMGKVAQPLRVALTGHTVSPGIVETLRFAGAARTLARIDRCLMLRTA